MIKISGVFCVFTGCLCLISCWEKGEKKRQALCSEWISLFVSWEYALRSKKIRIYDFLSQSDSEAAELNLFLSEVKDKLQKNIYPTGQQVWREACLAHEKELFFGGESREIILAAGDAFFAKNSAESFHNITVARERMECLLKELRCEHAAKKRLVFPAGLLLGAAIIILLI